jgi:hypothetical protein
VVSPHTIPVETDIEPAHVACVIGAADKAIRSTYAYFADYRGPVFPWDINDKLKSETGKLSIDAFRTVLEHSFQPLSSPRVYKKVFNTPQICMMDAAYASVPFGGSVLIIDPRDSDLKRIGMAVAKHGTTRNITTYVQSSRNIDLPRRVNLMGPHITSRLQHMARTVDSLLDQDDLSGAFSAIIFNVNFAKFLGDRDRGKFLASLRSKLAKSGRIYGSYVDHNAIRDLSKDTTLAASNQVTIYNERPLNGNEGSFITRIGSEDAYEDFILTEEALAAYVLPTERLTILPARVFCRQRPIPATLKGALDHPHIMMIRIAVWETGRSSPLATVTNPDPEFNPLTTPDRFDGAAGKYNVNRGMPFGDVDLFYHHPAHTIITPKADGRESVLWTQEGKTYMMTRRRDLVYEANFHLPDELHLQVELIAAKGSTDILRPQWIVLTDVISWPGGEVGYAARMRGVKALIGGASVITFPPSMPAGMHPTLSRLRADYPTDGYVLNHRSALPGMFRSGRGAARYLKEFYTKEIKGADGLIYEVPFDGVDRPGFPRLRPDRTKPSSDRDLRALQGAWSIDDYVLRVHYLSTMPLNLSYLIEREPRKQRPHYIFNAADLIYLWTPWRDRSIETTIHDRYGPEAVEWFQAELAEAMDRMIRQVAAPYASPEPPQAQAAPVSPPDITNFD